MASFGKIVAGGYADDATDPPRHSRLQAGIFGEHHFVIAHYERRTSDYPGRQKDYAPLAPVSEAQQIIVNDRYIAVVLPSNHEITLDRTIERRVHQPSYANTPFMSADQSIP